ncbi:MAG: hypothetical protein V3U11_11115 [Planctomycetota bacterium]
MIAAAVAAVWCWFSWNAWWQSDDFIALHYTTSWRRTLSDFWGNQYDLPALVYFYRPLITLSWAIDGMFGGTDPMVSHLHNAILHGLCAMLVAMIVHPLLQRGALVSWFAGLLWGLSPAHVGVVAWAAGRTGIYCTFFMLMSLWFMLRWVDGRQRTRTLSFVFFGLALASKELAIVLPGIVMLIGYCVADKRYRLLGALRHGWPYLVVLAVYLIWRLILFGGVGGYESGAIESGKTIIGLGTWLTRVVNPLGYGGYGLLEGIAGQDLSWTHWLGFLPALVGVIMMLRWPDPDKLGALCVLFLLCAIPSYQLWAHTDNPKELRLFYLPGIAIAVIVAYGGWRTGLPALLFAVLPFLELKEEYQANWESLRIQHQELWRAAQEDTEYDTIFVYGLARENATHTALAFHLGVDRLLQPPFAPLDGGKRCMALRPLVQRPDAHRVPWGDVDGVPFQRTYSFIQPRILAGLGGAPVGGLALRYLGPSQLTIEVLEQMAKNEIDPPQVQILGKRAERYRVTVFTAGGYLTTFVDDESPGGGSDGMFTIRQLLFASHRRGGGRGEMAWALREPTALDLDPFFPVLVEVDDNDHGSKSTAGFRATHANRAPIYLRLDRRYARWLTPSPR